jgi:hypothetical protein
MRPEAEMTSSECKAKAREYYRVALKTVDPNTRRALFDLVVRWRELAAQIDQLN